MTLFKCSRTAGLLALLLASLWMKPLMAAGEWFPFDMSVEDFWVADEKGFRSSNNVSVPEGTTLEIHCAWAVRPTAYVEVKQKLMWNGNVVRADGHTQGLFPIEIPPDKYGDTQWESGGVLGVGSTSHSIHGTKKLEGEFKTGWNAVGAGDHKLSCVLDSFGSNLDLEKTRANNLREITVTVIQSKASAIPDSPLPTGANRAQPAVTATTTPIWADSHTDLPGSEEPTVATGTRAINAGNAERDNSTGAVENLAAASGIRAMTVKDDNPAAPPNPCRTTVSYYTPEAPELATSGSALQVNDQLQIQCAFKKVTRNIEWSQCDDSARSAIQILKGAQEAGGRYSGVVSIDDSTVGVSSSPESGVDFHSIKLWKFEKPGTHKISCQIDNAFRFAMEGEETYLKADVSVDVGTRSDGLTYRGFEQANATTLRVRPMPSEAIPRLRGLTRESLEPAAKQAGGTDMVNPSLNPQPEVPSSKQVGGHDMVNPSLNPQPEVPSSKRGGGTDMVNPSLNPQPEVPSPKGDDTAITVAPESLPELVVPKPVENRGGY
jgi:hypothetical protein